MSSIPQASMQKSESAKVKPNMQKQPYFTAVGRRKEAVAKVRLVEEKGQITINGKALNEYFASKVAQKIFLKPFEVTKTVGKFNASVKILGGGSAAQLDALVHGVSRALAQSDKEYRTLLKKSGLLTRDARVKERRKYGHAQKARARKQSPKR